MIALIVENSLLIGASNIMFNLHENWYICPTKFANVR